MGTQVARNATQTVTATTVSPPAIETAASRSSSSSTRRKPMAAGRPAWRRPVSRRPTAYTAASAARSFPIHQCADGRKHQRMSGIRIKKKAAVVPARTSPMIRNAPRSAARTLAPEAMSPPRDFESEDRSCVPPPSRPSAPSIFMGGVGPPMKCGSGFAAIATGDHSQEAIEGRRSSHQDHAGIGPTATLYHGPPGNPARHPR